MRDNVCVLKFLLSNSKVLAVEGHKDTEKRVGTVGAAST